VTAQSMAQKNATAIKGELFRDLLHADKILI
jgi:hypothetical protein